MKSQTVFLITGLKGTLNQKEESFKVSGLKA